MSSTHTFESHIGQEITPRKTPESYGYRKVSHNWPEPETEPEGIYLHSETKALCQQIVSIRHSHLNARHQEIFLLHGPKQRYAHTAGQPIPPLNDGHEMLVAVDFVGLNQIDWKAP